MARRSAADRQAGLGIASGYSDRVQASVHGFDEQTGFGSVLLDDGVERWFDGEVFFGSGLRHLRVGQRVSVEIEGETVTRLWIVGIGEGQPIR